MLQKEAYQRILNIKTERNEHPLDSLRSALLHSL